MGNTHTCGVIIEDHGDANDGLRQTAELQVRSLSEPQYPERTAVYQPGRVLRIPFWQAALLRGKRAGGRRSSGRRWSAWAMKRASWRCSAPGTEGYSGISSPRRYLWDETPAVQDWRFSQMNSKTQREPLATAFPLMNLMNDDGAAALYAAAGRAPAGLLSAVQPQHPDDRTCSAELLAQALGQINSVATRLRLGFPASPRQLRTLILTLPSAMPKQEREIFRRRMFEAIAIVWKAMGWHPQDDDFASR